MAEQLAWERAFDEGPAVRGTLHPVAGAEDVIVLAHGAGSNRDSKLLVALAEAVSEQGLAVLHIDLPYRQKRPKGPPHPSGAAADREGIRRAAESLRESYSGRLFLGGSSYGGRQASMLAAEERSLAAGLLLLSYPLHPPGKPDNLRVEHFGDLAVPALFVSGAKDPFGTEAEFSRHLPTIAGPTRFELVPGNHSPKGQDDAIIALIRSFLSL